jgi:hypothetical protein
MRFIARRKAVAAAALDGALGAAGVAYATIPTNGVISACYTKSGGSLRVIDSTTGTCSSRETSLAWNVQGAKGDPGATGPAGPAGPAGATGAQGPAGISGYEVVEKIESKQPLPFNDDVGPICPTGKKVLGGGYVVQLFNDGGFVSLGGPATASYPVGDNAWNARIDQSVVGSATKATVTVRATCATIGS